jgi:hypothetical protein
MLSLNKNHDLSSVGFYWGNATGGAFTNGAHKAYLKIPLNASQAKYFLFSETTSLRQIRTGKEKSCLYNLNGQRINGDYHGVVIKNGKKYLMNGQSANTY